MRFFEIPNDELDAGITHIWEKFHVTLDREDLRRVMKEVQRNRGPNHLAVPAAMEEALDESGIRDPARRNFFKKAIGRVLNYRKEKLSEAGRMPGKRNDILAGLEGDQFTFAIMPRIFKKVASR